MNKFRGPDDFFVGKIEKWGKISGSDFMFVHRFVRRTVLFLSCSRACVCAGFCSLFSICCCSIHCTHMNLMVRQYYNIIAVYNVRALLTLHLSTISHTYEVQTIWKCIPYSIFHSLQSDTVLKVVSSVPFYAAFLVPWLLSLYFVIVVCIYFTPFAFSLHPAARRWCVFYQFSLFFIFRLLSAVRFV